MKINIYKKFPRPVLQVVDIAAKVAKVQGVSLYLVGGIIRDLIMGRRNLDLDLVIGGDSFEFARRLAGRLNAQYKINRDFYTAKVIMPQQAIDIAAMRREVYPYPASLPKVEPCFSLKEDLYRRDFTINSLALSLNSKDFLEIIDPYAGINDIKKKVIRIHHKNSFFDDPTRMFRAIRFKSRFGFRFCPYTGRMFKQALSQGMLEKLSKTRIIDELNIIFKETDPFSAAGQVLSTIGFAYLHKDVNPGARDLHKLKRASAWAGQRFKNIDFSLLLFMFLFSFLKKRQKVYTLSNACAFSKNKRQNLILGWDKNRWLNRLARARGAFDLYFLLKPFSSEVLTLLYAFGDKKHRKRLSLFVEKYRDIYIAIKGRDLKRIGIPEGVRYNTIFKFVLKEKLAGRVKTYQQELALAKKIARRNFR